MKKEFEGFVEQQLKKTLFTANRENLALMSSALLTIVLENPKTRKALFEIVNVSVDIDIERRVKEAQPEEAKPKEPKAPKEPKVKVQKEKKIRVAESSDEQIASRLNTMLASVPDVMDELHSDDGEDEPEDDETEGMLD